MAWLELHQQLRNHPKLHHLHSLVAPEGDIDLVRSKLENLWLWALDYSDEHGKIEFAKAAPTPKYLSEISGWRGDPVAWMSGLVGSGWIDRDGNDLLLHDWEQYAGKYLARRAADARRKADERARLHPPRKERKASAPPPAEVAVPDDLRGLTLYEADKRLCSKWSYLLDEWRNAFPGVNVLNEVRRAHAWEVSNPERQKKDRLRFLYKWLSQAQDSRRPGAPGAVAFRPSNRKPWYIGKGKADCAYCHGTGRGEIAPGTGQEYPCACVPRPDVAGKK